MKDTLEVLMLEDKEFLAKLCMYYSRQAENFERALDLSCDMLYMLAVNDENYQSLKIKEWKEWLIIHSSL